MRSLLAVLAIACMTILATVAILRSGAQTAPAAPKIDRTPVVVELFTSEGCSSCPPADTLLAGLGERQPIEKVEVIALEEHVDYWDNLGWVDPFSSHDWTARQYVYAGILGNGNAYTPQMVVDGKTEFIGSHSGKARQAILNAAAQQKTRVTLVRGNPNSAGSETLSVKIGKLAETPKRDTAEVWLAITETKLHTAVKRGENAGEDLRHAAVVRTIRKVGEAKYGDETSFAGEVTVPLQTEWKLENLKTVVFVQEKRGRRILGAADLPMAP